MGHRPAICGSSLYDLIDCIAGCTLRTVPRRVFDPPQDDIPTGGRVVLAQWTVIFTAFEAMPFAITSRVEGPVSVAPSTVNWVDTILLPVATPELKFLVC